MKKLITLALLLIATNAFAFGFWDSADLGFGSQTKTFSLPAREALLLSLPFDGTFPGTFSRSSFAWNPETGAVAPHNLLIQSSNFNNVAWVVGGGTTRTTNTITFGNDAADALLQIRGTSTPIGTRAVCSIEVSGSGTIRLYELNGAGSPMPATLVTIELTSTPTRYATISSVSIHAGISNGIWIQNGADGQAKTFNIHSAQYNFYSLTSYVPTTTAPVYGPRYVTGKSGQAILIEEASTNLIATNTDFTNATWVKTGVTINGQQLTETTGSSTHDMFWNTALTPTAGQPVTIWAKVKPISGSTWFIMQDRGSGGLSYYDCSGAGTLGATTGAILGRTITLGADGYYKCTLTVTAGASVLFSTYLANGNNVVSYAGSTGRVFEILKTQVEALPYATSEINTTNAAVTRTTDMASYPTAGALTSAQGTIAMWVKVDLAIQADTQEHAMFDHWDGSGFNRIYMYKYAISNTYAFFLTNNAGASNGVQTGALPLTAGWHLFALSWISGNTNLYIDGVSKITSTSTNTPSALGANFRIGNNVQGNSVLSQPLDALRTYNRPLTAAEHQRLFRYGR